MRLLSVSLLIAGIECAAQTVTFDRTKIGPVGRDWTIAMTHEGGAPNWEILDDPTAPSKPNVIAQTSSDNTSGRFPLATPLRMAR